MATTATPLPYWKVLKPHSNGHKIAGKRRALGDVFQAAEPVVRFQALESIVGECDAQGVLKHPPAAPQTTVSGGH